MNYSIDDLVRRLHAGLLDDVDLTRLDGPISRCRPRAEGGWIADAGPHETVMASRDEALDECERRVRRAGGGWVYELDRFGLMVHARKISAAASDAERSGAAGRDRADPPADSSRRQGVPDRRFAKDVVRSSESHAEMPIVALAEAMRSIDDAAVRAEGSRSGVEATTWSPETWCGAVRQPEHDHTYDTLVDWLEPKLEQLGKLARTLIDNRDFIKLARVLVTRNPSG